MSGAFASVSRRGIPLPTGIRYNAQLPFFARSSAMSGLPTIQRWSGDHAMRADGPPAMRKSDSFRSPPPAGRTEYTFVPPPGWSRRNAISCPSGDQTGFVSAAESVVSRRTSDEPTVFT